MSAVQKAIQDGVGERRVADVFVPVLDGQLAGDQSGSGADAIVQQLEQIGALPRANGGDRKVIDHHEVDLGDGGQSSAKAAVGMTKTEFIEQPRGAQIQSG